MALPPTGSFVPVNQSLKPQTQKMKKQQINISLFLLASVMLMTTAGCKKNTSDLQNDNEYYARFKTDGVQQNYTIGVSPNPATLAIGSNQVTIYSTGATTVSMQNITIYFFTLIPLTSNFTHTETDLLLGTQPEIIFRYSKNLASNNYYPITNYDHAGTNPLYAGLVRNFRVTVTAVTATTIKGTFSGTVYHENANGDADLSDKIQITNGEFFLPIKF
jgi:hypothetical protein